MEPYVFLSFGQGSGDSLLGKSDQKHWECLHRAQRGKRFASILGKTWKQDSRWVYNNVKSKVEKIYIEVYQMYIKFKKHYRVYTYITYIKYKKFTKQSLQNI